MSCGHTHAHPLVTKFGIFQAHLCMVKLAQSWILDSNIAVGRETGTMFFLNLHALIKLSNKIVDLFSNYLSTLVKAPLSPTTCYDIAK